MTSKELTVLDDILEDADPGDVRLFGLMLTALGGVVDERRVVVGGVDYAEAWQRRKKVVLPKPIYNQLRHEMIAYGITDPETGNVVRLSKDVVPYWSANTWSE